MAVDEADTVLARLHRAMAPHEMGDSDRPFVRRHIGPGPEAMSQSAGLLDPGVVRFSRRDFAGRAVVDQVEQQRGRKSQKVLKQRRQPGRCEKYPPSRFGAFFSSRTRVCQSGRGGLGLQELPSRMSMAVSLRRVGPEKGTQAGFPFASSRTQAMCRRAFLDARHGSFSLGSVSNQSATSANRYHARARHARIISV